MDQATVKCSSWSTQAMCADLDVGTDREGGSVLVEADCRAFQICAVCLQFSLSMHVFVAMLRFWERAVGVMLAELRDEAGEWDNQALLLSITWNIGISHYSLRNGIINMVLIRSHALWSSEEQFKVPSFWSDSHINARHLWIQHSTNKTLLTKLFVDSLALRHTLFPVSTRWSHTTPPPTFPVAFFPQRLSAVTFPSRDLWVCRATLWMNGSRQPVREVKVPLDGYTAAEQWVTECDARVCVCPYMSL